MPGVKLSVNVNKYALLRNSRGANAPDLLAAIDVVLAAGAHGITIHPRRDQRHVRYDDIRAVADHLAARHPGVELNVECENHPEVLAHVLDVRPAQCTLVPVRPGEVTSDHGYRFPEDAGALVPTIDRLHAAGVRTSIFMECTPEPMAAAAATGTDRVELYTGPYAWAWGRDTQAAARADAFAAAAAAVAAGLEVNAGHDLDRHNLIGLRGLPGLLEVSIGHAQICRALEVGTTRSVQELLAALGPAA
ncbi:MAG: pyridoxine 5'-phosphate synthase [Alphaproteobacteria bacterium]|nr:pyridoxine 5'-phosphate synthase [Alphaproteobacteria bacterium]